MLWLTQRGAYIHSAAQVCTQAMKVKYCRALRTSQHCAVLACPQSLKLLLGIAGRRICLLGCSAGVPYVTGCHCGFVCSVISPWEGGVWGVFGGRVVWVGLGGC